MVTKLKVVLFVIPLLAAGQLVLAADERQPQQPTKAQELTGLIGVKENTKGRLSVENQNLRFIHSHGTSDVTANSIQDVITGSDSQRVIRGTLGTLSRFGPYGSDRFLSLFRSKMDTLTIRYRDGDGGIHGVIFTTPVGQAEVIRDQLVGLGAHPDRRNIKPKRFRSLGRERSGLVSTKQPQDENRCIRDHRYDDPV